MRQANRQASVIQISPSGRVTSRFAPFGNSFNFGSDIGVPGLGFDYPHLAAISGALRNGSSFRFGHRGHRGEDSFTPIFFGGYPFYYEDLGFNDLGYEQPVQQSQPQPQIIVIQQAAPAQPAAETASDAGNLPAPTYAPPAPEPVRDVGDFILVRRDGRILFASVFSVVGTQLQYVTPEGIRHTLPMSEIDADATQQMNEARGTTVAIHNGPA
jgi:hypothetical protein